MQVIVIRGVSVTVLIKKVVPDILTDMKYPVSHLSVIIVSVLPPLQL